MSLDSDENILQAKARQWATAVVKLNDTEVPAALENEKKALLSFAKKVKEAIEKAIGTVPQLDPLNQLGVIPAVVGVVGVAAAGAAITKWYTDYKKFLAKVETYNSLRNEGNSAQTAAAIADSVAGSPPSMITSVFSDTKKIVGLGIAGLLAYYLMRKRGMI